MKKSIIDQIFEQHFSSIGNSVYPEQRKIIEPLLEGKNTLAIMPTGGGKSLCYQIAGLALKGTTIAIFPLTALIDEQAEKLRNLGLTVTVLHSGISSTQQYEQIIELYKKQLPNFIFTSPERVATDGFLEFVLHERRADIPLVVVDEIHCVSQWGHDFRPFYREIPTFLNNVFEEEWPVFLGLTATLNQPDQETIRRDFRIKKSGVVKSEQILRNNIDLDVIKTTDDDTKDILFWEQLSKKKNEKVLIYQDKKQGKRSVEAMAQQATSLGLKAVAFHGDMTTTAKLDIINKFKTGEILTVFATSAFGMGIDIPDIRGVIHYRPPESIEQYYQQIGRAGRDQQPSWATLYYSDKNIEFRKTHFIARSFPTATSLRTGYEAIVPKSKRGRGGAVKTFNIFDQDEDTQTAYHYLVRHGFVKFLFRGIRRIDTFSPVGSLPEFDAYYAPVANSGILLTSARKTNTPAEKICMDIFRWIATKQLKIDASPAKCLFVERMKDELDDNDFEQMLIDAEEKKLYRFDLLDQFADLLDQYAGSQELHRQIGQYLGLQPYQYNRSHKTVSGILVRSKSEVIIANLLTKHQVNFEYEQLLTANGKRYSPDFTITDADNNVWYWEHLGMLHKEDYRQEWAKKEAWYNKHFPNQLLTTKESATLSQRSEALILQYFVQEEQPEADILKTVFISDVLEEDKEEKEENQSKAPQLFPEINQIEDDDLKVNLSRAASLLTVENVDVGMFQFGKIFEEELKKLVVCAEQSGKYAIFRKDKERLVSMIECVLRENIVTNKNELTYLRQERNESAHGNIPDQERREQMLRKSQHLAGIYLLNIVDFSNKQQVIKANL